MPAAGLIRCCKAERHIRAMLRYSLICKAGHEFEGWFRDSAAYEAQATRGLLNCAICGSSSVEKAVMAPAIARRDRDVAAPAPPASGEQQAVPATAPVLLDAQAAGLRQMVRALRAHVEATAENVGADFARTARDMHDGLVETKPIYGVAAPEEVAALHEEGIEALPLPLLPDDRN
jgi:hypothetical protein